MSTTSLRLSDELQQRAVAATQKPGVSPQAFMVHAIEQAAISAERRASFVTEAQSALTRIDRVDKEKTWQKRLPKKPD